MVCSHSGTLLGNKKREFRYIYHGQTLKLFQIREASHERSHIVSFHLYKIIRIGKDMDTIKCLPVTLHIEIYRLIATRKRERKYPTADCGEDVLARRLYQK